MSERNKHDTNHAIRKTNINVLQTFDEIKLYSVPSSKSSSSSTATASGVHDASTSANERGDEATLAAEANGMLNSNSGCHSSQRLSRRGGTNTLASARKFSSPGHGHHSAGRSAATSNSSGSSSDIIEINLKEILDQIVAHVSKNQNVVEWFKFMPPTNVSINTEHTETSPVFDEPDLHLHEQVRKKNT